MTDPFLIVNSNDQYNSSKNSPTLLIANENDTQIIKSLQFEDDFICKETLKDLPNSCKYQPLADSQTYLEGLERKLDKLRKNSKLVQAIAEKRQDCLRSFLENDNWICGGDTLLELEQGIRNSTSSSICQSLYRQLQPVQAVTIGETVQLVQHDQLDQQDSDSEDDINREQEKQNH